MERREGFLLPVRRPRFFPALKGIAGVTVFAFTLTTIAPAGMAQKGPAPFDPQRGQAPSEELRALAGRESPEVRSGLEERLLSEGRDSPLSGTLEERDSPLSGTLEERDSPLSGTLEERDSPLSGTVPVSRRDFLKGAGAGAVALSPLSSLLSELFGSEQARAPLTAEQIDDGFRRLAARHPDFLKAGEAFLAGQKIGKEAPPVTPNIAGKRWRSAEADGDLKAAKAEYARLTREVFGQAEELKGLTFNGFFTEYAPGERDQALTRYGRTWMYTNALVLLYLSAAAAQARDEGKKGLARELSSRAEALAEAIIRLGLQEEALGFKHGYHFSYNTNPEEPWMDPRAPTGNNLWVVKALYAYMAAAGDFRYLEWVNDLRRRVLDGLQVTKETVPGIGENHIRYGLVRAMAYTEALERSNIDVIGYNVYQGDFNKIAGDISIEHNVDAAMVLVHAYQTNQAALDGGKVPAEQAAAIRRDLANIVNRNALLLNHLMRMWVEDSKAGDHFVTGIHFNPEKREWELNRSTAVDNESWAGAAVLPYSPEVARKAYRHLNREFMVRGADGEPGQPIAEIIPHLPKAEREAAEAAVKAGTLDPKRRLYGYSFFDRAFMDRFIKDIVPPGHPHRPLWERMIQPEATFGAIQFAKELAKAERDPARQRRIIGQAVRIYEDQARLHGLYGGKGMPYSSVPLILFTNLQSTTATVSGLLAGLGTDDFLMPAPPEAMKKGIRLAPPRGRLETRPVKGGLEETAVPVPMVRVPVAPAAPATPAEPLRTASNIWQRRAASAAATAEPAPQPGDGSRPGPVPTALITPVSLPSPDGFWTPQGKRPYQKEPWDQIRKLLRRARTTDSRGSLLAFAKALELEPVSGDAETLRGQVVEALARRYQFHERDLVGLRPGDRRAPGDAKRLRAANKLRRAAGLTTIDIQRAWRERRYVLYQAREGKRVVKAVVVARAQQEGLMGMSFETVELINRLQDQGVDVTVLALGTHAPEAFALQYAGDALSRGDETYLNRLIPPEELERATGYVTFVVPSEAQNGLKVEHTTDPLVAWTKHRLGDGAAADVALSLDSRSHLRQARLAGQNPAVLDRGLERAYAGLGQVREGLFERRAIDARALAEKEQDRVERGGLVGAAMLLFGMAAFFGMVNTADAQAPPAPPGAPELLSTNAQPGQPPVMIRPFTPKAEVDAAIGELPARVRPTLPSAPPSEGPGVVGKITVPDGKPDRAVATQTEVPRALTTPANFSREQKQTAWSRLTQTMAGIRTWVRQKVYGADDPQTWSASKAPRDSMILPDARTGFTVWNPERLEDLGPDRVEAVFASIANGARRQGNRPFLLYEIQWAVTLARAQREEGPVNEAVLRKVRSHVELAHKHGIQVVALYSGTEAVGDPAAAIQHLGIAAQMGFDRTMVVTDMEPWAVPPESPDGRWQRALAEMQAAVAAGDAQGVSRARQKLLNEAVAWQFAHEEILRRVVPKDRAYLETLDGPPEVHALVQPAFVPILKLGAQWRQVRRLAEAQGFNVRRAWDVFDSVTAPELGESWTERELAEALVAEGLKIQETDLAVSLPDRLKLIVMAFSYPNGNEAAAVAEQMRMARAGGFASNLGLAVNLEWGNPLESLGSRSEEAGRITEGIVVELKRPGARTGFDGKTVYVHVADELGLVDLTREGRLTLPRQITPKQVERAGAIAAEVAARVFGIPQKQVWEEHWIPQPESAKEFAKRQAVSRLWGVGGGVVGIGPWYALDQNLQNWIAYGLPVIHPDTGPTGPEAGGGLGSSMVVLGALTSGHARVSDMHLHLIKRNAQGRIVREEVVRHIPGRNSPIISGDVWDEAFLEVTVRRVGENRWGPRLIVDMAAKVENRDVATVDSPRETWSSAALYPWQRKVTFRVDLPELMAGANNFVLLTHDSQGRIMEWVGAAQNTRYITPYAPFLAEAAAGRLARAAEDLRVLKIQLGKQPGDILTRKELAAAGRHDLIADQQALGLNPLSLRTGNRAKTGFFFELTGDFDMDQADALLGEIKFRGIDSLAIRVPAIEFEAQRALAQSDAGRDPSSTGFFQGELFSRLTDFVEHAHRNGIRIHLTIDTEELVRKAEAVKRDPAARKGAHTGEEILWLLKILLMANERGGWNIDSFGFHQPNPDPGQRRLIERVVRDGLDSPMIVIGPDGVSSTDSLYAVTVDLKAETRQVLDAVDRVIARPQPKGPRGERFDRGVMLRGGSLTDLRDWLRALPTVGSDGPAQRWGGMAALTARMRTPAPQTLNRLGFAPTVIEEVLRRAPTVTQEELSESLGLGESKKEPEPWARALVDALAEELKEISEVPQVERYGSSYDNAMLSLYGIQLTPLILTEAQRAEVTPLVPMHLSPDNGSVFLGVQVANPADPELVRGPAIYDVWVHIDYPSWTDRPTAVHKSFTMILKPGESAPAWIEVTGLPEDETSLAVRVRVLPRGVEEHRPGQIGSRTNPEQALEMTGFVILGSDAPDSAPGDRLSQEEEAFSQRWKSWTKVYGIRPGDPGYEDHYERQLKAWFGVGTPAQRAVVNVRRDPNTGEITGVDIAPANSVLAEARLQAQAVRREIAAWQTEQLTRVREQPPTLGRTVMTWIYVALAKAALIGAAAGYLIEMARGYRRAAQLNRYYRRRREEAIRVGPSGSVIPRPVGETSQVVSVTSEEAIRVAGPLGANFIHQPAQLLAGQRQPTTAMESYGKDGVIVLDDSTEQMSQNIHRTPIEAFGPRQPGQPAPAPEADRAFFHRAAPRLFGLTVLAGVGAFLLGTPAGWLAAGVAAAAALWSGLYLSQRMRTAAGHLLAAPMRLAGSRGVNHPLTVGVAGGAAVVGGIALALTFGVPLTVLAGVAGVWAVVAMRMARPSPARIPGAAGIAALGTAVLLILVNMTLPVWWGVAGSAATLLITQRLLIQWLESPLPMQGFLRGLWEAARFLVKWGLIAAALYGLFGVLGPALWGVMSGWLKTAVVLPLLGPLVPTVGALIVGVVLLLNLVWQGVLFWNLRAQRAAPRRGGLNFLLLGIGVPALILGSFLVWGAAPAAAVWVFIWTAGLLLYGAGQALMGLEALSVRVRERFEGRDGVQARLAPDERVLLYENGIHPTRRDLETWLGAWADAAADQPQRKRQGIRPLPAAPNLIPPGAALTAAEVRDRAARLERELRSLSSAQRRLVNLHYWKRRSVQTAQGTAGFGGLSAQDQEFLIRHHFNRFLMAHLDTVYSGDLGGTLLRTFGYGWWTATADRFVRRMRNDDRVVAIMPALLLSIVWAPGELDDPWGRIKRGQVWLIGWEIFRILLASVTVPLGFFASMLNRNLRALFTRDSNVLAPFALRADAGMKGYAEPVYYVIYVMGRWLVGHIFVLMRAYLGRQITRNAADRLGVHRWERKEGSVRERIERLRREAAEALAGPNPDPALYRRRMAAAHYAALTGGRNVTFDLGETPPPGPHKEAEFSRAGGKAGTDPGTDDTRMPPELAAGSLAGTVGMKLSSPQFHFPMRVEWNAASRSATLSLDPGRVNFWMPAERVKAWGADTGFQILEGRFSAEVDVVPVSNPQPGGPTHELKVSVRSEEDEAFPELSKVREAVADPRDREKGMRRQEGREAGRAMAARTHERQAGVRLGSDEDATAVSPVELGSDLYKDQQGLWYQFRLNFFGWLRARYLGLKPDGTPSAWRAALWWAGTFAFAGFVAWVVGSVALGAGLVIAPWMISLFLGTLIPLSFIGLGIQDTVLQGMKAHYEGAFLETAMEGFFQGTPAAARSVEGMDVAGYRALLRQGWELIQQDETLRGLVEIYPLLMHPEHPRYKRLSSFRLFGIELWPQRAAPIWVERVRVLLADPGVPTDRWALRRRVKEEILRRAERQAGTDATRWSAFREAFTRNTQLELAAVGNKTAGIQYHRSRSWDVFRGGDVNRQFAVKGQDPLVSAMEELEIPTKKLRSWASVSPGTFYAGVRMPSQMTDNTGQWIAPLQAFLDRAPDQQTVNQFMLEHTELQPDLEAVNAFLREESLEVIRQLDVAGMTVTLADQALAGRENRLGLPAGSFLRFSDLGWSDEILRERLRRLQESVERDGGELALSAARLPSEGVRRFLMGARWWAIALGLAGGVVLPSLFGWVVLPAWVLGLQFVRTGAASLSRWVQPRVWKKAIWSWKEPYSDEVILLSLLYGVKKDQAVMAPGKRVVDLKWSALDGLYDASRWRLALGTYLFPGTPVGRLPLWERGGAMIHAPPVPFLAALRLLEEPPWLASASGFNRLPTDAFEIGESFAEDTLFGLVNLHRPTLNPTANALNLHKLDYLFGQEELRKRDSATVRAIQLFKGIGMAESIRHLLDHPMLAPYQRSEAGKTIQKIFGWDMDRTAPSGSSVFGMEAFRRDEVATAGARGAGTLSYGYSGFTASDLFGRRVGPFAPGEVAAYWKYREYEELDEVWGADPARSEQGLFFKTLRFLQRRHQQALDSRATPEALLGGLAVDPWLVLAEAGASIAQQQAGPASLSRSEAVRKAAEALFQPSLAGLEEPAAPPSAGPEEIALPRPTGRTSLRSPGSESGWSPAEEQTSVKTAAFPAGPVGGTGLLEAAVSVPALPAVSAERPPSPASATPPSEPVAGDSRRLAMAEARVRTAFEKVVPELAAQVAGIGPRQAERHWSELAKLAAVAHLLPEPVRQRLFVVAPDATRGLEISRAGLIASSDPLVVVDRLREVWVGRKAVLEYDAETAQRLALEEAVALLGASMVVRSPARGLGSAAGLGALLRMLLANLMEVSPEEVSSYVELEELVQEIEIIVGA